MNQTILEVNGLSLGYKGHTVIQNINLSFERGKVYSIIGPNGCGKTTLMRALSRNIKPERGEILLYGNNILRMNTKKVAKHLALLAQNNDTMSDVTVRHLVQYGRFAHKPWWQGNSKDDEEIVDWALEKTGMSNYSNRKITALSGGERQRAWIAMSVAQKPEILLLDEPTTFLDISHQLEIMELIKRLNQEENITIIMVLHDINHAARYSDELVVISEGKVFRKGDPWNILESDVLEQVFHVEADITEDNQNGTPIFYARKVVS